MSRFSKIKKPKAVEPRFRPNVKQFSLPLMVSWSGATGRAARRCEEDADAILEVLTSDLPSGTFDKVVAGVLDRLGRDYFYNERVRANAQHLAALHRDPDNRSF